MQGDMSELRVTLEEDLGEQEIAIGELKADLSLKDNEIKLAHKIIEEQREKEKISDEEFTNLQNIMANHTTESEKALEDNKVHILHLKALLDTKDDELLTSEQLVVDQKNSINKLETRLTEVS